MERGRAVYNGRCYFCHGYDGNAETVAAAMLDPKPIDFTQSPGLDHDRIVAALLKGKPGTAMRPFTDLISAAEIEDVASFVAKIFVECGARNTSYHTPANGWPDHEARYGAAFAFATGELPLDVPERLLDTGEQAGLALFRSACISCHDGRLARPSAIGLTSPGGTAAEADFWDGRADHDDDYDTPGVHDIVPVIADPTPSERLGQTLYAALCADCHAADGTGLNWIGRFLRPGPPDFTTWRFVDNFDTAQFASRTLDAPLGTTMPSFRGVLSGPQANAIADYVRRVFIHSPEQN
ncbi:MAG: c-type cytochrome [Alphaproteobacteria bacterium]